jgi:hypothetical protein
MEKHYKRNIMTDDKESEACNITHKHVQDKVYLVLTH